MTQKGNNILFGLGQEAAEGSVHLRISTSEAGLTISFSVEAMDYEDFVLIFVRSLRRT